MVDEGALQHLVQLAQVVLVGHPVAGAADQPEHHAARLPVVRARDQRRPRRASTGRLICHQVRTRSKPAAASQRCWRLVVGERAGVDLLDVEPARGADLAGLADRPLEQHVGAARRRRRRAGRARRCARTASGRRPGRGRCPRRGSRPSASRRTTFSASAAPARRPRRARRPPTRRPSRGRAARGRAAAGSAGRRRTGRPGPGCRPPSPSGRSGPSSGSTSSSGSLSNRRLLGDHEPVRCAALHGRSATVRSSRDGSACGRSVRRGVRYALRGVPGGCRARRGRRRRSCSSSATRTMASAARSSASSSRAASRPSARRLGPPGLGVELAGRARRRAAAAEVRATSSSASAISSRRDRRLMLARTRRARRCAAR